MKAIQLTQGKVALIDDADFEQVSKFKWFAHRMRRRFYADRKLRKPDGTWGHQLMHRFLVPDSVEVDHRDGDGLNNQRQNLRPLTHQQNTWGFCRKKIGATSKFRGVSWKKSALKWHAQIMVDGNKAHLGYFQSEDAAARAYDVAARKYLGEFASPNFPLNKD